MAPAQSGRPAPFLPMSRAEMDGARLGRLRHRARHRRRLCRSSELRHGDHRPAARGAGLPGRHHRAARLAVGRAVQGAGQAAPVLRRHRRQHGLDGQPLHGGRKIRSDDAYTPGGEGGRRPDRAPSSTPSAAARRSRTCRSCSAASRRRCAASPTTTTGPTRCAARCWSTPRPTCCSSAMPSAPSSRWRNRLAAGEAPRDLARRPRRRAVPPRARATTPSCAPTISTPPTRARPASPATP